MNQNKATRRGILRTSWLAGALAGALALGGCGRDSDAANADEASTGVSVGTENVEVARTEPIRSGPLISGSLRAEQEATIRAEVGGSVTQVSAEQGQPVRRGALLARIEDTGVRDAYVSAQSAVRSAENALQVAQRDSERTQQLVQGGALAERDLEVARSGLAAAQAQLAGARAQLASANRQLESTQVRSPINGVVSQRQVNAGDVVAPGAALFTVIDPGEMELEAAVPSEQLSTLRVGAPVEFEVSGYPGRTFTGKVERINPAADPTTRQVPIFVSIPNSEGTLVAGLFAQGRIASQSHEGVTAPASAVDETGASPSVVRLRGGRAERVPVQIGLRDTAAERVEITSGIAVGDTLLIGAARGITPGTPVRIENRAPATAAR